MRTKRYFGKSTRDAMLKVNAALGSDALILANRQVASGIEILASASGSKLSSKPKRDASQPRDLTSLLNGTGQIAAVSMSLPEIERRIVRLRRIENTNEPLILQLTAQMLEQPSAKPSA